MVRMLVKMIAENSFKFSSFISSGFDQVPLGNFPKGSTAEEQYPIKITLLSSKPIKIRLILRGTLI